MSSLYISSYWRISFVSLWHGWNTAEHAIPILLYDLLDDRQLRFCPLALMV